jgi:hypothetical protein
MTASTVSRTGIATEAKPRAIGPIMNGVVWTHTLATTSTDENNDAVNMGYLPAGVTCFGFSVACADIDSATAAVWKITIGSTDVKTGMTIGQADSKVTHSLTQFLSIAPYTTTAETLVKVTFTTAAGTPVAGDMTLVPFYIGN